ncbi:MAG: GHKL domain-containing protein [Clostridia bacterium]|nr:GHKL domain-containing protein [Clostridia bacterium]
MEILTALITPNPELIKHLLIPIYFLDAFISMLLFTTILKFNATRKQKLLYVLILSIFSIITKVIAPSYSGILFNILFSFIIIWLIFRKTVVKTSIASILPALIMTPIEVLVVSLLSNLSSITLEMIQTIPAYRLLSMGLIYLISFIIYLIASKFKINLKILSSMKGKLKHIFILNVLLAFVTISIQLYLTYYYSSVLPLTISVLSIISLTAYFLISLHNLQNTTLLEVATRDIQRLELYNKTLTLLQDTLRTFRHDFGNILQAIGGYIGREDVEGLKTYYAQLSEDYKKVNNLSTLNPEVINEPSIFGILASKYHIADEFGIKINLEIFMNLNKINMKIFEFTRILGILLDNAIEASKECENKIINVTMRQETRKNLQLIIIENTYNDKNLDTLKIFDKDYSTKPGNTGLGLWQVNQILNKNKNISLFTTKNETFFIQQLEIYKL